MPVAHSTHCSTLSMDGVQAYLDLLVSKLEGGDLEVSDIIGAYMSTSRVPLCGRSLDQAVSKDEGRTVDVRSVGPVDKPSADAVNIFAASIPGSRKILLLSTLSFCQFSEAARLRIYDLAKAFDMMIERGISG